MAAQKGRLLLIKVDDNGSFINAGGLRTKSLKINNEQVDCTTDDSAGIRQLLEGAGVNSIEVSGSGVVSDEKGFDLLRAAAENNEHIECEVTIPGDTYSRVYEGTFAVAECEQAGEYNGAATYTLTLQSADEIAKSRIGG